MDADRSGESGESDGESAGPATGPADPDAHAARVVLSYPPRLDEGARDALDGDAFRRYLGRAHDVARPGDRWSEFVSVGCCGATADVELRVERVEGDGDDPATAAVGSGRVDPETAFGFEPRTG